MKPGNNTFSVLFYLKKSKASNDGIAPIYARITVNGSRLEISLKRTIAIANWNSNKNMPKGSKDETRKLVLFLERYRSGLVECYQDLLLKRDITITAKMVKDKFTGEDKTDYTLCKLMDYHNDNQGEILEIGTMKNYLTTQKYLKEFLNKKYKTTDKFLSEITFRFIVEFESFLRNRKPELRQRKLANNGVMKHLERLSKMINLAVRHEWLERNPFSAFQLKFEKVERSFLSKEELDRIEKKDFSIERLQIVKDLFIFGCYTGLSYIDVFNLTTNELEERNKESVWIVTHRQKTKTIVKIPLLPKAKAIIEKYSNYAVNSSIGRLLPSLSNQKLNSYLKEIADACKIAKPLTFHIARHTFATTITLSNGVPIETVGKLLGHTKLTTTQIYAKVLDDKLSEDMENLKHKLVN